MQSIKFENVRTSSLDLVVMHFLGHHRDTILEHRHQFFEIVFIQKGCGTHIIDKKQYPMLANDIYLMPPNVSHSVLIENDIKYINIIFKKTLFSKSTWDTLKNLSGLEILKKDKTIKSLNKLALNPIHSKKIVDSSHIIKNEIKYQKPGWQLMATEACINLLITISRAWDSYGNHRPHENLHPGPISKALELINTHWNEELNVRILADHVHLSQNYFGEVFKDAMGMSPQQYINKIRIEHSRSLLEENILSINEIALKVGYEDNSYFTRVFKKNCGLSPLAYRNLIYDT